jgi:hypothetical protein
MMTEYAQPNGLPTGATFGVVLDGTYVERMQSLQDVYEHQWAALEAPHDRERCPACAMQEQLRPRPDEYVLCAICWCCSLLAEEPDDGVDFCSGGCEPPSSVHAPIKNEASE